MSAKPNNRHQARYYYGGLAEIVNTPSQLTYSYIKEWFTGANSLGIAASMLNLPYSKTNNPVLELSNGELAVNLKNEEKTLYGSTIMEYEDYFDSSALPRLKLNLIKALNPKRLLGTAQILFTQASWVAHSEKTIAYAQHLIDTFPAEPKTANLDQLNVLISNKVWPRVIAVGMLSEFFHQMTLKEAKSESAQVSSYISFHLSKKDWFFQSIADQLKVKKGEMSFETYILSYGIRADRDFELTSPRWHEIPDTIKARIDESFEDGGKIQITPHIDNKKILELANHTITLQMLRSIAKQKALLQFNQLRQQLLGTQIFVDSDTFSTKETSTKSSNKQAEITHTLEADLVDDVSPTQGIGTSVSRGNATGKVMHIISNDVQVPPGVVGIFPNASPEFAIQYPKCVGLIFLRGGQTSHGSIVAREFAIPAIIDKHAAYIPENSSVALNATHGEWKIL